MNLTDITKQIRAFADQLESTQTPAPVDPYAKLKAAHAAGKVIQSFNRDRGGMWQDCLSPAFEGGTDYRIKPDAPPFQLPPPPPGMQWHRTTDWTAEMLPTGTRPLCFNETAIDRECEAYNGGSWTVQTILPSGCVINGAHSGGFYRTARPLVFTHAGKSWTWHRPGDPMPCDGERAVEVLFEDGLPSKFHKLGACWKWDCLTRYNTIIGWRYAEPLTREVELGPEDVEPLSMIRRKGEGQSWHWRLLSYVHGTHAICADRGYSWSELARDYEINRPRHRDADGNPTKWEKCSKTITTL